ncbi:MAG TPA: NrsF family protein [Terracidiphilus sp.]|jgi:hypothetical protein
MMPDKIDEMLARAAQRAIPTDAGRAAMDRARAALIKDLRPVQPIPPVWAFTLILVGAFVVVGGASASLLGLHGVHALSPMQRTFIFPALLAAAWVAALGCARAMRPAGGSRLGAAALAIASAAFPVLFSLIFNGYGTRSFVHEGIPCLVAGMCVAIPTALVITFILRRGYVMSWAAAGVAAGSLAGLTGLAMLELHCPNLKAIHVMVWHVAVVVVSGVLGWAAGAIAGAVQRRSAPQPER